MPKKSKPRAPVPTELHKATLEQVARAIFAGAKKPDPSQRRD